MKKNEVKNFTAIRQIHTYDDLSVTKKEFNNDFEIHWHSHFEIEIILNGEGTHIFNGESYDIKEGHAYILTPDDFHEMKPQGPIRLYNISFHESMLSKELLNALLENKKNNIFNFNLEEFKEVISLCEIIDNENKNKKIYRNEFLKSMLECFLIIFLRKTEPLKSESKKNDSHYFQQAILYLKMHFKENPTLKETAGAVNLNPNYFSEKFKEFTGESFISYLTSLKISYAKKLISSTSLNITEICFASGFTSLSNFMKVFKKQTGKSPSAYRKSID